MSGTVGTVALGARGAVEPDARSPQRCREMERARIGGVDERQVLIDDVSSLAGRRHSAVRRADAQPLSTPARIEADAERGSREADEDAALDQALEVEGDVESRGSELAAHGQDLAHAPGQ